MPTLEDDGWELESAEERHQAAPGSFDIPSRQERTRLGVGARAKLLFLFMNEEDGKPIIDCERMWVTIASVEGGRYTGTLESRPVTCAVIGPGQRVSFGPEHVASISVPRTDPRHPEYRAPEAPRDPTSVSSVGLRALAASAIAGAILLGLSSPYFLSKGRILAGTLAGVAAIAAVVFAKRVTRQTPGAAFSGLAVGAIVGFVVIVNVFPYRGATAAWGLAPETTSARMVVVGLYLLGAVGGAFLGSFAPSRRTP
jgi:hypothetical protein